MKLAPSEADRLSDLLGLGGTPQREGRRETIEVRARGAAQQAVTPSRFASRIAAPHTRQGIVERAPAPATRGSFAARRQLNNDTSQRFGVAIPTSGQSDGG